MAENVAITINGHSLEVPIDTTILEAARLLNIEIPTLCNNENVKPYGVCRICIVEIDEGRRKRVVPACVYNIRRSINIETDTEKIRKHRKILLTLQLARCPDEPVIRALAAKYGVTELHPRLYKDNESCILCGLCARVCSEIVGVSAIAFEGRGPKRRVTPPFDEENPVCIACGACAYICPTKCIGLHDIDGLRTLKRWHRSSKMVACEKCGDFFIPEATVQVLGNRMKIDSGSLKLCTHCRPPVF